MPTTIYEVARQAGVSTSTVSRALRGDPRISAATRETVQRAADALDYLPRPAARALAENRMHTLGLVLPHIDGPYYADLLVGFEAEASRLGYSVMVTLANPRDDARRAVRELAGHTDAIAFGARSAAGDDLVAEVGRTHPVATVARAHVGGHDAFLVHNRRTAKALTAHLVASGRSRLAFVGDPEPGSDLGRRHQGFLDALSEAGLPPTTMPVFPDEPSGARLARQLLGDGLRHDALVCGNDQVALALMTTLTAGGVSIGTDVAVTGWDDLLASRYVSPTLTTVSQPVRQLGGLVARRLAQRIAGEDPTDEVTTLPATIVHRASCGCGDDHPDPTPTHEEHP